MVFEKIFVTGNSGAVGMPLLDNIKNELHGVTVDLESAIMAGYKPDSFSNVMELVRK